MPEIPFVFTMMLLLPPALALSLLNCSTCLLLWKGGDSQVWFDDLEVWEQLLRLLVLDAWVYNNIVAWYPVDRSRDLVLVTSL